MITVHWLIQPMTSKIRVKQRRDLTMILGQIEVSVIFMNISSHRSNVQLNIIRTKIYTFTVNSIHLKKRRKHENYKEIINFFVKTQLDLFLNFHLHF